MNTEIEKMLTKAEYFKIVWTGKLNRYMFQAYDTSNSLTNDEQLTGGGELPVLIEWLQKVHDANN